MHPPLLNHVDDREMSFLIKAKMLLNSRSPRKKRIKIKKLDFLRSKRKNMQCSP